MLRKDTDGCGVPQQQLALDRADSYFPGVWGTDACPPAPTPVKRSERHQEEEGS